MQERQRRQNGDRARAQTPHRRLPRGRTPTMPKTQRQPLKSPAAQRCRHPESMRSAPQRQSAPKAQSPRKPENCDHGSVCSLLACYRSPVHAHSHAHTRTCGPLPHTLYLTTRPEAPTNLPVYSGTTSVAQTVIVCELGDKRLCCRCLRRLLRRQGRQGCQRHCLDRRRRGRVH